MAGSVLLLRTMLVYGDPFFEDNLGDQLQHLSARIGDMLQSGDTPALDALRTLLIHVGQLEQAV
ncbi:MAG TPA: hypothetical protein VHP11_05320 [Tepidisphaeraceae bacterium]|nr:hypothetical protein [Tepidisphaeraceae bacterium]